MDEPFFSAPAEQVRALYAASKRQYDQVKAVGRPISEEQVERTLEKFDKPIHTSGLTVWEEVSRYCEINNLDVGRLIEAFFLAQQNRSFQWPPSKLMSGEVMQQYKELCPSVTDCTRDLQSQLDQLEFICDKNWMMNGADMLTTLRSCLASTDTPYSPLFRYCHLFRIGLRAEAQKWMVPALGQYLRDQDTYNSAWKDYIAGSLKEVAASHLVRISA